MIVNPDVNAYTDTKSPGKLRKTQNNKKTQMKTKKWEACSCSDFCPPKLLERRWLQLGDVSSFFAADSFFL